MVNPAVFFIISRKPLLVQRLWPESFISISYDST